ncbi:MAG TPA: phasin family protein [Thermohalobaculum sp.]|nr:phasin family protein [Thermohalobaculum sp.]
MPKQNRRNQTESEARKADNRTEAPSAFAPLVNGPDIEQVAEAGQRSLTTLAHLHSRAFRDALKFNAELLDFARRRVTADIEATDRLAHCETVTEAMDALSAFYQGAFRDYAEQTTALVRLGSTISSESAEEIVAEAARLSDRKPG